MSISGWLTGIGMDGTRPLAEQPESLRPGGVLWAGPLRLEEEVLPGIPAEEEGVEEEEEGAGREWGMSGEEPEDEAEEEEICLWAAEDLRGALVVGPSLMVTVFAGFDLDMIKTCGETVYIIRIAS